MRIAKTFVAVMASVLMAETASAQFEHPKDTSRRMGHWDWNMITKYQIGKTISAQGGSNLELDDDFGWGFSFGYNVNERLNVGMDFTWNQINYAANIVPDSPLLSPVGYGNSADTGAAMFTAAVNFLPRRMTPYANGGIGWAWTNSNIFAGYASGCYWDPWYGYICGSYPTTYGQDGTGYQLGGGVRYDAGRAFFFKFGYNHAWADFGTKTHGFSQIRFDWGATF